MEENGKLGTVEYSHACIYKLCCKDPTITDTYIGSTTNFLRRKSEHKRKCHNANSEHYNRYVYTKIRELGGFDNWEMVLVESVNCYSKLELSQKEREHIDLLKPTLNVVIPLRPREKWQAQYNSKRHIQKKFTQLCEEKIKMARLLDCKMKKLIFKAWLLQV